MRLVMLVPNTTCHYVHMAVMKTSRNQFVGCQDLKMVSSKARFEFRQVGMLLYMVVSYNVYAKTSSFYLILTGLGFTKIRLRALWRVRACVSVSTRVHTHQTLMLCCARESLFVQNKQGWSEFHFQVFVLGVPEMGVFTALLDRISAWRYLAWWGWV